MADVHVCSDMVLPWQKQIESAWLASKETAENTELYNPLLLADLARAPEGLEVGAAVLLTGKKWANGRVIKIAFLDGDPALQRKVANYANTWMEYVNLTFQWVGNPSQADIRITFTRGGSWSYLGVDNLTISKPKPTMQFGWITANSNENEIRRVVVHEFGHMLGLGHEQGHPKGNIPWNKPVVYAYYKRTNGWDEATVNSQVFKLYEASQTNYSEYDKFSIMHYSIPAEHLTDPNRAVPWNTDYSPTDIAHMRKMYPKADEPTKPQPPPPRPEPPAKATLVQDIRAAGFVPLRNRLNEINVIGKAFSEAEVEKLLHVGKKHNRPITVLDASTDGHAKVTFGKE